MFEAATMLYLYVETPLHVGSGRSLGAVDLPIQREATTGYPIVQASGLKGRLRAEARERMKESPEEFKAIFGPETGNAADHAGALAPADARLLLFPLRSLAGVFAWATSRDVLARFQRDTAMVGLGLDWSLPPEPGSTEGLVSGDALVAGGKVVLEEFAFEPTQSPEVKKIGQWLASHCLPESEEYAYWRETLPGRLVLLPEDAFRDFTRLSTEVATRVKLALETKTVEKGALWTEESLPADSLLWAPLMASPSRAPNGPRLTGAEVLQRVAALGAGRRQLGGDETVGRGVVFMRFGPIGGKR